jgi:hypothetical protein
VSLAAISEVIPIKSTHFGDETKFGKGGIHTSVQVLNFMEGHHFVDMESCVSFIVGMKVVTQASFALRAVVLKIPGVMLSGVRPRQPNALVETPIHVTDYGANNIPWSSAALLVCGLVKITMM